MKKALMTIAAAVSLTACVTAPTNPAELAAWNEAKTARTEARRPEAGSITPGQAYKPEAFEELKDQFDMRDQLTGY